MARPSRYRLLLIGLTLAAYPFLRGRSAGLGETERHRRLRLAIEQAIVAIGGRYDPAAPPAAIAPAELARAWLTAVLEACDALGMAPSDIAAVFHHHERCPPAARPPETRP